MIRAGLRWYPISFGYDKVVRIGEGRRHVLLDLVLLERRDVL
jgi:hypothetical protein